MAHPSDLATALVALDAEVVLVSLNRERRVSLKDLFSGPNSLQETILDFDELLTEFRVPRQKSRSYQAFVKEQVRHSADFALVSVGIVARIVKGTCQDIRIALGGVASFPRIPLTAEEILRGRGWNERLISKAAETSAEGTRPLSMNSYKVDLTKALMRRALTSVWQVSVSD